jgi:hypothetical protein
VRKGVERGESMQLQPNLTNKRIDIIRAIANVSDPSLPTFLNTTLSVNVHLFGADIYLVYMQGLDKNQT